MSIVIPHPFFCFFETKLVKKLPFRFFETKLVKKLPLCCALEIDMQDVKILLGNNRSASRELRESEEIPLSSFGQSAWIKR
jgi:hypothetical protein